MFSQPNRPIAFLSIQKHHKMVNTAGFHKAVFSFLLLKPLKLMAKKALRSTRYTQLFSKSPHNLFQTAQATLQCKNKRLFVSGFQKHITQTLGLLRLPNLKRIILINSNEYRCPMKKLLHQKNERRKVKLLRLFSYVTKSVHIFPLLC